jgi:hypothetical protein
MIAWRQPGLHSIAGGLFCMRYITSTEPPEIYILNKQERCVQKLIEK